MTRTAPLHALASALLVLGSVAPVGAARADEGGIPVRIEVTDADGKPVSTAVVQYPGEDVRHEVDKVHGAWEGTKFYNQDGTEIPFLPGVSLTLSVSAPGYRSQDVEYLVKKRKNVLVVALETLPASSGDPKVDPVVGFDHDDPIDGATP